MSLLLREISLDLNEDESLLAMKVAAYFSVEQSSITSLRIIRKGIDARKKQRVKRIFTVAFSHPDEERLLERFNGDRRVARESEPAALQTFSVAPGKKALVVGMGPAGLFAALHLARQGVAVTLVERGEPVEKRTQSIQKFWRGGEFNPRSNVQFGEGGAGTFSDGKLTTRVNSPFCRYVLQAFVDCGAPADILFEAKPHLGTDVLRKLLINFRRQLVELGVEIRFDSCLTSLSMHDGRVCGGVVNGDEEIDADAVIIALGHSARDTYGMLAKTGVRMEQKPFAIGLRVEHPAELINEIQYGHARHRNLPTADYSLSYNDRSSGRGAYSFCMCPGGEVVIAPSEEHGMVVNGMSYRMRNLPHSNSALVVSVGPADFPGDDPLAGVRFQRQWEQAAFVAGGGDYHAPAQNMLAFLGQGSGGFQASCRPGVREADLCAVLPAEVASGLKDALPRFDRKMRGFVTGEAVLVGIESRTSAPLRITRDAECESVSHPGLYPAGEGAGYAGGIMSAALDGLRVASSLVNTFI